MEREDHDEESRNADLIEQSKAELKPGDVTWIKLRGASWWPAQVFDEKAVSGSVKPRKGKSGEVLVRLYGTYEYLVHQVRKKHNGNEREIFEKALKQFLDLSESPSGRSKSQSPKVTGKTKTENGSVGKDGPAKRATDEQDEAKKKIRPDSPSTDITSEKSPGTARRLKVMQGLGLTAPPGSPFIKNGRVLSILQ
ncbi:hypothetical protein Cgig2_003088 [Carnegiea gigantea]|uniref:PWWP domain-containing protein n=1 Tax=Carnegiea gigantea TaxID=171969 RepID=A0A9Q1JIW4_9CARY|nr:hypothetical protein Cgig2_003088 [Carnegiea gigantea]